MLSVAHCVSCHMWHAVCAVICVDSQLRIYLFVCCTRSASSTVCLCLRTLWRTLCAVSGMLRTEYTCCEVAGSTEPHMCTNKLQVLSTRLGKRPKCIIPEWPVQGGLSRVGCPRYPGLAVKGGLHMVCIRGGLSRVGCQLSVGFYCKLLRKGFSVQTRVEFRGKLIRID